MIGNGTPEEVYTEEEQRLRDQFAMAALQGLLATHRLFEDGGTSWHGWESELIRDAYDFADRALNYRRRDTDWTRSIQPRSSS